MSLGVQDGITARLGEILGNQELGSGMITNWWISLFELEGPGQQSGSGYRKGGLCQ